MLYRIRISACESDKEQLVAVWLVCIWNVLRFPAINPAAASFTLGKDG
jgi:hypothetical protein